MASYRAAFTDDDEPPARPAPQALVVRQADLAADVDTWSARAHSLRIVDRESCTNASLLLRSIKNLRSGVADYWAPHIEAAQETKRKADASRKALVDERTRMDAPLVAAEDVLKRGLLAYEAAQETTRLAQERALQAEAVRQAEIQTRQAAEALAREGEATGDQALVQEAADILAQPIDAPVVHIAPSVPKVAGVTYRDNWKVHPEIDVRALAAAVADGRAPVTLLVPNLTALGQIARATQGTQPVPGVRFWNDRGIAARA